MKRFALVAVALLAGLAARAESPAVAVSLAAVQEEGKKMLVATVTRDGKPVEGARVAFTVERTFGRMTLGSDVTIDDGTAAVAFPLNLPGGPSGELTFVAVVDSPAATARVTLPGGLVLLPDPDPFPSTLWSPRAPPALLATFAILLGGVWCAYAYVMAQVLFIRKGGHP